LANRRIYFAITGLAVLILILILVGIYYSTNIAANLALVATSIGLIFATFRLKSATDGLVSATQNLVLTTRNLVLATEEVARNQILPRLSRTSHFWNEEQQALTFQIRNTGTGTAYGVKARAVTPAGVFWSIEPDLKGSDLRADETWTYSLIGVATRELRELRVDFEYSDAKDYPYKQSIIISK